MGDDPATLDAMVDESAARNAAVGISGILWSGKGAFVQALEGGSDAITQTMKRIERDERHTDIAVLCDCIVRSRMFGNWAMIRSNDEPDSTIGTPYLIGYAGRQRSPSGRRIVELLLADGD